MYLDSERALYKTFGLRRSLAMVYNKATVAYYGGLKAEGKPLHKGTNYIQDHTVTCYILHIYLEQYKLLIG